MTAQTKLTGLALILAPPAAQMEAKVAQDVLTRRDGASPALAMARWASLVRVRASLLAAVFSLPGVVRLDKASSLAVVKLGKVTPAVRLGKAATPPAARLGRAVSPAASLEKAASTAKEVRSGKAARTAKAVRSAKAAVLASLMTTTTTARSAKSASLAAATAAFRGAARLTMTTTSLIA